MRRLVTTSAFVVSALVPVQAQTYTMLAEWDPNPASDNVTQYRMTIDGGMVYYLDAGACTTVCAQPFPVALGSHTVALVAINSFGTSPESGLTFSLSVPGKSGNLRIRIP